MKHLIYLTTSMEEKDYKEFLSHWSVALNPSNQNFHNKLIRALSLNYDIDVISIRPFSKKLCDFKKLKSETHQVNNVTWHYPHVHRNQFSKFISCKYEVRRLIKELYKEGTLILTDTINPSISYFLSSANKDHKYKTIGVLTDSPSNISNTRRSYATYLLKSNSSHDAYIALTDELNSLYNISNSPYIVVEGIVENPANIGKNPAKKPYFYFGGALLSRYGVYDLIEAFTKIEAEFKNVQLYIAGHHEEKDRLNNAIKKCKNIHYLKCLNKDEVLTYEAYALANINPRPFSEDLDRFSIPSKTLEYLSSGRPTISVKNTKLGKVFYEDIIWAKSSNKDDLYESMYKVLTDKEKVNNEIALKAKEKVLSLYGFKPVSDKIKELLETI